MEGPVGEVVYSSFTYDAASDMIVFETEQIVDSGVLPITMHDQIPSSEGVRLEFDATGDCDALISRQPNGWNDPLYDDPVTELTSASRVSDPFTSDVWVVLQYLITSTAGCTNAFYIEVELDWYLNQSVDGESVQLHHEYSEATIHRSNGTSQEFEYCNVFIEDAKTAEIGSRAEDGCNGEGQSTVELEGEDPLVQIEFTMAVELWGEIQGEDPEWRATHGRMMHNASVRVL